MSPHRAVAKLRDALQEHFLSLVAEAVGVALFAVILSAYFHMRLYVATPNWVLRGGTWTAPDDGIDAAGRQFLKHYLVLAWHLLMALPLCTGAGL